MKKPYYLILIALGIALIITGAIVFNRTEFVNPTKIEQVKVFDLIHHSGGYVNIAVEHPSELLPKEEAQITLTASPDEKIRAVIDKGFMLDSVMNSSRLTTSTERRQTIQLKDGSSQIIWQIKAAIIGDAQVKVSLAVDDPRSNTDLYPLIPQENVEFFIPIVDAKTEPKVSDYLGHIMIGFGVIILVAGFIIASKDFDKAIKNQKKKSKKR